MQTVLLPYCVKQNGINHEATVRHGRSIYTRGPREPSSIPRANSIRNYFPAPNCSPLRASLMASEQYNIAKHTVRQA